MNRKVQVGVAVRCEDQLGAAIRCLRAVQQGRTLAIRRACEEYPALNSIGSYEVLQQAGQETVHRLKEHILQLARAEVREDIEQLHNDAPALPAAQLTTRRQSIAAKIAKLKPRDRRTLQALRAADGLVTTEPKEIAGGFGRH